MYNLAIRKCTSPPLLAPRLKIFNLKFLFCEKFGFMEKSHFENKPFNCVLWNDDDRKGEGETRCRLIACSSRKAPKGSPGLTSPSDGEIAINSTV